jgi:folate-binding protein YgfZ
VTPQPIPAPPESPDAGVPWHYGDPHAEQRALAAGRGAVDLSHREVLEVTGADRLPWLHSLTTAHLLDLPAGASRLVLVLSPHGHVEHELHLVETGTSVLVSVEPGTGEALRAYLDAMRFLMRVEVLARPDLAVVWEPQALPDPAGLPTWVVPGDYRGGEPTPAGSDRGGDASRYVPSRPAPLVGREVLVPRDALGARVADSGSPAGTWALEALRVAAAVPRIGLETDHRTLPHEVGWVGPGVHLAKGCYRGQEAVARVHNLGRPPRRLALAHLDGSANVLPAHGDAVLLGDRVVGWVGTPARHHELGPIATVVLKRATDPAADLLIRAADGEIVAGQEVVVAP